MDVDGAPLIMPEHGVVPFDGDIAEEVMHRLGSSQIEHHQLLCATAGAIAQSLRDQSLPPTPVAYFAASAASLSRLCGLHLDPSVPPLLEFFSLVLPVTTPAVVRSRYGEVVETLVRILGANPLPDAVAVAGMRCAGHLLVVADKGRWVGVETLFQAILSFVSDPRRKVRKQCHLCLHNALQGFQNSIILTQASKEIKNTFERSLLLAGGSKAACSTEEDGPRGAVEVLYILNALRDCLPLMSSDYKGLILKFFSPLLEMKQTIVMRSIMDVLQTLCYSATMEVSAQDLLDLLCSVASAVDDKERSADGLASIARLLHHGIKKVYDLDRQKCALKLPMIFSSLGDILAFEHEEAVLAATEALKGLIYSCINENLIIQGVEQIKVIQGGGIRKSGPTIIEKICSTMEGFIGYRYNAVWDKSFQVISVAFEIIGSHSSFLMVGTIKSLADMQSFPVENLPHRKLLLDCIGSAISAIGPEAFLNIVPFNLDAEDLSSANIWLFPILKQHIVGTYLSFFTHYILGMVGIVSRKTQKLEEEGRTFSSSITEGLVYSLWSLLPAFCNYPVDTSSSFKTLHIELLNTLNEQPELHGIICSSLQILIKQNKVENSTSAVMDGELSVAERKAKDHYTSQVRKENLDVIKSCAPDFLKVLSGIYLSTSKDSGGFLQATIREFASIAEEEVVIKHFMDLMKKLLKMTNNVGKVKQCKSSDAMQIDKPPGILLLQERALLFDVAVSFLPGLDMIHIEVLFSTIMPAFEDNEGLIQKKAYKTLSTILKERRGFFSTKMDVLIELLIAVLPSCHFSAKRHRLDCLYYIIVDVFENTLGQKRKECIASFLTEIILALKESNKKTRNRAYELLVEIGRAYGDEEREGKKEKLQQFFNMVAGALAGDTPHMISAAVRGLARLAYEFSDLVGATYNLLPSAFLLMQRKNREIVKANLGLLKVLIAKSNADGLQVHLKGFIEGLLNWQYDTKNHFKAKVKLLIEMLIRKCGVDAVRAVMPEEHMKLLTNIRKIKERKERKAKSECDAESFQSKTSISRQSRWNHTRIFSDLGTDDEDDDTEITRKGTRTVTGRQSRGSNVSVSKTSSLRLRRMHRSCNSLPGDSLDQSENGSIEDDPLDLLDCQRVRSAIRSSSLPKRVPEHHDDVELDSEGRLIIRDDIKSNKRKDLPSDSDSKTLAASKSLPSYSARAAKKRKATESGWAYTGSEYTSRTARGDVKKKDKLEPYAYWPLDRKLLNRREERKVVARKGMAKVMKYAKKFEGKSCSSALRIKFPKKHRGNKKKK